MKKILPHRPNPQSKPDGAHIGNFIAGYMGSGFTSAMDLNSFFKRSFEFIKDAHFIPRNNI